MSTEELKCHACGETSPLQRADYDYKTPIWDEVLGEHDVSVGTLFGNSTLECPHCGTHRGSKEMPKDKS